MSLEIVQIVLFLLIPAYPAAIAFGCLKIRRRWLIMDIVRWTLLTACTVILLVWLVRPRALIHLGLDLYVVGPAFMQFAMAYIVALILSCLSPWRRPKIAQGLST